MAAPTLLLLYGLRLSLEQHLACEEERGGFSFRERGREVEGGAHLLLRLLAAARDGRWWAGDGDGWGAACVWGGANLDKHAGGLPGGGVSLTQGAEDASGRRCQ